MGHRAIDRSPFSKNEIAARVITGTYHATDRIGL